MRSVLFSMRWWLTLAFAAVAVVSAAAVVAVTSTRSERAVREATQQLAVGRTVRAAEQVQATTGPAQLAAVVRAASGRHEMALFAFDADGRLITADASHGFGVEAVPRRQRAVAAALDGRRFLGSGPDGTATVFAVPLYDGPAAVLLGYSVRPEVRTGYEAVLDELGIAAVSATLLGAAVGLVIALWIAARLRRIERAAAAIGRGELDSPLRALVPDEIGSVAASIDRMRLELRAGMEALAADRDRLERLLARLHEGVIAVTPDLEVEFANDRARELLGERLEHGRRLPDGYVELSVHGLLRGLPDHPGGVRQVPVTLESGHELTVTGISLDDGSAIVVLADETERLRSARTQREFAENAAHELRTPVTAILSSAEQLQAGAKYEPEDRDRFLDHIHREAERLARLSRSLLVLARAQAGQERPSVAEVRLEPLLEEVAARLDVAPGVRVRVDAEKDVVALADPALLEQALVSLASNAARYTTAGDITLAARELDASVLVSVADTGPGIPAAEQDRIFERFYRANGRDGSGFGLGLAIAREATQAMSGRIDLVSEPGLGTTVRLSLPGLQHVPEREADGT